MKSILNDLVWLPGPFTIVTNDGHRDMLKIAYDHGNNNSPDPSTKNGAILVRGHDNIVSFGVNRFPAGIAETKSRLEDRATKYRIVVHAEHSAILAAAKHGVGTKLLTMYCPFYACTECAKSIINAGIREVIGHAQLMAIAFEHTTWVESIRLAWQTLQEAGVKCTLYDGKVGVTTRFHEQDIEL